MPKLFVMPLKPFTYAREGVPELFEPGLDENGGAIVFEFEQHQAENCERLGWGKIVNVRRVVQVQIDQSANAEQVVEPSNLVDAPSVGRADMQMRVVVETAADQQPGPGTPQKGDPDPADKPAGAKTTRKSK